MIKSIIPECNIDTNLINTLLNVEGKKGTNHTKGVSTVAKKMQEKFADKFSVGIIDKDKKGIAYLKNEFLVINNTISDYALLYKHKTKHHYFVQLCPESEDWICNVAKKLGIDLTEDYKVPDIPHELGEVTKNLVSKEDKTFTKLFKEIVNKAEAANFEPVLKMRRWLTMLVERNYQADINELKK